MFLHASLLILIEWVHMLISAYSVLYTCSHIDTYTYTDTHARTSLTKTHSETEVLKSVRNA